MVAAFAAAALYGDPRSAGPVGRAEIATAPTPALPGPAAPEAPRARPGSPDPGRRDAETVEAGSGVSVVRPPGTSAPASVVVQVPDDPGRLKPAPDPRLAEASRYGILPRVGPDGARALEVYARPVGATPSGAAAPRRVAVVVGGLGIARGVSEDAVVRLPPAVTLALAPYGSDLEGLAAGARASGHEILLQVPMEPFDYPESDPGPHTLLVTARPADNLDHLRWAMGRFTGYVGLVNYMGGKLTADERALGPVLKEAGERGLGVLDDGSSSRSVLVAAAGSTPAARAALVVDAVPRADLIDAALARLESAAAPGRVAIATASALPVTLERIARWAEGLEARGIVLVPVSAALVAPPRTAGAR